MRKQGKPQKIALEILELLKRHSDGLNIYEIRERLPKEEREKQEQLGRRLRELDPFFEIERIRSGRMTIYKYRGQRPEGDWEYDKISKKDRAEIMHKAGGRCQMCGRTISEDGIKLHIDHKIPKSWTWDRKTKIENLWAICAPCNEGKRNYFASFDPELMKIVLKYKSVHQRIAELLHQKQGDWVDSDLIEFVANATEYQADWQKRLRELRYFNLNIESRRLKRGRKIISEYRLNNWVDLPANPTQAAREYEKVRAKRNKINRNVQS